MRTTYGRLREWSDAVITRIEIDSFKTFEDFSLDLPPFLVILGPNAVGKSNLFDALRLLSDLATKDVHQALSENRGDPLDLFRRGPDGAPSETIRLAVECLLPASVEGAWGEEIAIPYRRLRYEIRLRRLEGGRGLERVVVDQERVDTILRKNDSGFVRNLGSVVSKDRVKQLVQYDKRWNLQPLSISNDGSFYTIPQDKRPGRPFVILRDKHQPRSIISTMNSSEYPHLFAVRKELSGIRFLALDASAMRPNPRLVPQDSLSPTGHNLAAVLARLKVDTQDEERPKGILVDIGNDLARLVQGVRGVDVAEDKAAGDYRLTIETRGDGSIPSQVASDGTLRLLALLTLLHDPRSNGLVCFEEPENGVHPWRLSELVSLLRDDVLASFDGDGGAPLQVICNSHSPVVLAALRDDRQKFAVFFDLVSRVGPSGARSVTRARPIEYGALFTSGARDQPTVLEREVQRYLASAEEPAAE